MSKRVQEGLHTINARTLQEQVKQMYKKKEKEKEKRKIIKKERMKWNEKGDYREIKKREQYNNRYNEIQLSNDS